MTGSFTISLDFELHWGGFEKWPMENYRQYFINTRKVIPEMLAVFREYEIHVTWATVGLLFHHNKSELLTNIPKSRPSFRQEELSAYHYIETNGIGEDELDDPFHYAPSLIRRILETPFQEVGTHTYSHYYCNEAGQTAEQFRDDLRAASRAAGMYGVKLQSLVFPRNQFNSQYLKVCVEEGITAVRSNPLDCFWQIGSTQNESMWKRLNRGLDAYFPVGKNNTYTLSSIPSETGLPLQIPASRLLRPYNPKEFVLNSFKIGRIKNEMARAASRGEVYHLWWHPHNFGNYPEQSMEGLRSIARHYAYCRDQWNMSSHTMSELASLRRNGK